MAELDIEAIAARADAATPGPWVAGKFWPGDNAVMSLSYDDPAVAVCGEEHPGIYPASADAAFIAASRQDVPALVAEVRQLRAALAEAEACAGCPCCADGGTDESHRREWDLDGAL